MTRSTKVYFLKDAKIRGTFYILEIVSILFAACGVHDARKESNRNYHSHYSGPYQRSLQRKSSKKSRYWKQCAHIGPTRQPTKRRVRLTRQTAQQPTVCRAKSIRGGDRELPLAPSFHPRLLPDYPLPPPFSAPPILFCSLVSFFGMPLTFSLAPLPNKRAIPVHPPPRRPPFITTLSTVLSPL